MQELKLPQWRLKAGSDRRFRSGHPWVYSNELQTSPKGIEPGAPVELLDAGGKFLARGYGNPASLIAFRVLSRDEMEVDPWGEAFLKKRLDSARALREAAGLRDSSYRLCFGEADGLPGLIIDRYAFAKGGQGFVIQAHAAGMDRLLDKIINVLDPEASVVVRNDVGVRKLEGLTEQEPRIARGKPGTQIKVGGIEFEVDLVNGQKTGFFLDQVANVQLATTRLKNLRPASGKTLKILDLCCYVGQWSAQLAAAFKAQGLDVEVTAVDASATALELARKNIEAQGARCQTLKGDVLKDLGDLGAESFDIVISDPPALIKGRKDIPVGKHAYLQLNTQAFRLLRRGGAIVTCSCSGLLPEDEFVESVAKAARRNARFTRWIARGSQSPDHPMLAEFPEGRYLKCWIGINE